MKLNNRMLFLITIFATLILNSNILAHIWEVGFKVKNVRDSATTKTITIYTFNSASRELIYYDSGQTTNSFLSYPQGCNGAFDIGTDTNIDNPTIPPLSAGLNFYLKIGEYFYIFVYSGSGAYGDVTILYKDGGGSSAINDNSGYYVEGPYTWSDHFITLKNEFGQDAATVSGDIIFNSITISNIGLSGTQLKRESLTFPHSASGIDNQYQGNYYRKWRQWNIGPAGLTVSFNSPDNYERTAIYAKQVNVNIENVFAQNYGGSIVVGTQYHSSPISNMYFYDDREYTIYAPPQTVNGIDYLFDHWKEDNLFYSSQSLITINNPGAHKSFSAYYNLGKPTNDGENISFGTTVGYPVKVKWEENPNTNVTSYQIWRMVNNGSPTLLGTVARGSILEFEDPEYLLNVWKVGTKLSYDVRAYYSVAGTYSDPIWADVYGQWYSMVENNEAELDKAKEIPTEFSVSNYPNPFNPTTTITYQLPEDGFVTLKVYDILGKEISDLVNEEKSAGYYNISFNAGNLTSGIYLYSIKCNNYQEVKKMLLMK
ncbi:MAG: T9SS type A sorting domain-containing protein [Ignavibacteriaceae bacterium]|nr:T9SS type A sorting domain-containing protein [Ignavibacteriaceae bacterium]